MTDQPHSASDLTDAGQPHLDIAGEADIREETPREGIGYALLTNRNNLLEILSSGLVKPASLYGKYYPDLGGVCPEAVPLLLRDPSSTLVDRMVGEDPTAFPVLLDIDLEGAAGTAQAVFADYRTDQVEMPLREDAVCLVVDGVVPATRVRAVHFRSEQELQEHTARAYENVRESAVPLQVSPERFQGRRLNLRSLLRALAHTHGTATAVQPEQVTRADALGGALLMVATLAEQDIRLPLAALAHVLELLHASEDTAGTLEREGDSGELVRHLVIFAAALLDDRNVADPGMQARVPVGDASAQHRSDPVADLLLTVVARTLATLSPEEYYGEAALESIRVGLERALESAASEDVGGLPPQYRMILDAIEAVVNSSMDLEEFPATEMPVATGLLQFLLQSDPSRAMSRALEVQRYDPGVAVVAVACSGALYGRAMIPVACRPEIRFERYVDEALARYLNHTGRGLSLPALDSLAVEAQPADDEQQEEVLKAADHILMHRRVLPPAAATTAGVGRDGMVDGPEVQGQVPMESFTPERADEAFRRLSTSDLGSGPEKEAAIRLCRAAGWNSCVITTIKLERPGAVVTDMPRAEVRMEGFVSSAVSIRMDRFRKELTAEAWAALPEHVRREVDTALRIT